MSDLPPPPPPGAGPPPPPPSAEYGYATPPPGGRPSYAGFGSRLGAFVIDSILVGLMFVPAIVAIAAGPTELEPCTVDASGDIDPFGDVDNAICEVPTTGTWVMFGLLGVAALIAALLYFSLLIGRRGQTVGKRAVGIKVVDATSGQPIGSGRALGRYLFQAFISGSICYLGYLWMLWDNDKQTWHDKVVRSIVVRA